MPNSETTQLTPDETQAFMKWVIDNGIADLDHPNSHYDYRGYWKDLVSKGKTAQGVNPTDGLMHFTDAYKQHGHPTFSQESNYSAGSPDGGMWVGGETFLPQPPLAVSHDQPLSKLEQYLLSRGGK